MYPSLDGPGTGSYDIPSGFGCPKLLFSGSWLLRGKATCEAKPAVAGGPRSLSGAYFGRPPDIGRGSKTTWTRLILSP